MLHDRGRDMSRGSASSLTEADPRARRSTMARRDKSARAENTSFRAVGDMGRSLAPAAPIVKQILTYFWSSRRWPGFDAYETMAGAQARSAGIE